MPALLAGGLATLGLLAPAAAPASQPAAHPALTAKQQARRLGALAYVYGSAPLLEQRVINNFPANHLISITRLATPAERLIPLPNVDTLYTVARLDLRAGPLVVHVPDEHGRYYTLQMLDAYTNTFAYIGRRVTGTRAGMFVIAGPGWSGHVPAGVRVIRAPTATVWLLGRTLVLSAADVARVNAIQHAYTLTPLSGGPPLAAIFLSSSTLKAPPLPTGLKFYDAMDAFLAQNPPPLAARALLHRLSAVGIGPGRAPSTENLSSGTRAGLLAGLALGRAQVSAYADRIAAASQRRNRGWLVPPKATGDYGTNYLLRAYIAQDALGANVPAEAIYPVAFVDSKLRPLSGRHRYTLRFAPGQLPPVKAFWSLTMYGRDLFLVPNPLGRYAIGNRTPHLRRGRDGSLTIYLQHAAPRAAAARTNWLPAPAGPFVLALRLYLPAPSAVRGTWPLPLITRTG